MFDDIEVVSVVEGDGSYEQNILLAELVVDNNSSHHNNTYFVDTIVVVVVVDMLNDCIEHLVSLSALVGVVVFVDDDYFYY